MDVKPARDDLRIRDRRVLRPRAKEGQSRLGKGHQAQPGQKGGKKGSRAGKGLWSWEGIAASSGAGGVPAHSSGSSSQIPKRDPLPASPASRIPFSIKVILVGDRRLLLPHSQALGPPRDRCAGRAAFNPPAKGNWLLRRFPDPKKTMKSCTKPIDFSHRPAERREE